MDISEVKNTIYHLTHECYGESEVADAICELRKFCDYLDTGLTPEEIMALQEKVKYAEFCAKSCLEYEQECDTLKKALELMATYLVHFGRLDEMLCDDIPQPLHLKYQPKNDGEYENEPCIKCVQEFYIQQAQEGNHE